VGYTVNRIGGRASIVIDEQVPADLVHPFRVSVFKDGSNHKARVRAGTVNNLVPKISTTYLDAATPPELTLTGDGTHKIYLKAAVGGTPVFFPDTVTVISNTTTQTDDDDYGYLQIASVTVSGGKVTSVNQYVYASQVLMRVKPGTATALWNWNSR
jgi:hypothetical protein